MKSQGHLIGWSCGWLSHVDDQGASEGFLFSDFEAGIKTDEVSSQPTKELAAVVDDSCDVATITWLERGQWPGVGSMDITLRGWNGVSVGVAVGVVHELIDAVDHQFRGRVFQYVGLVVYLVPGLAELAKRMRLEESMPSNYCGGLAAPGFTELDLSPGFVADQPETGELTDHLRPEDVDTISWSATAVFVTPALLIAPVATEPGATHNTSGEPVRTFKVSERLYNLNAGSDRDDDGIACEKL